MGKKTGTLYGIGAGPGDPDLITLKAAKILNQVDIVFAAASTKNNHSLAVNIARPHIPDNAAVEMLRFPMSRDKNKSCGQPNEEIVRDIDELSRCAPDYWTLIIAKQNKKNGLLEG
jgi:precorrin-2/cobalt-factor-2 C20-methyltransferase